MADIKRSRLNTSAEQPRCSALILVFLANFLMATLDSRVSDAQMQKTGAPHEVSAAASEAYKLQLRDFTYAGAFRVPIGNVGESTFSYGGTAIAFNPHRSSLFIVGHDHHQAVAEIEIPQLVNSFEIKDLNSARILQPFTNVRSKIPNFSLEGNTKIGGLLVVENELFGTFYEYYDANADARDSHFKLSSLNLSHAKASGLFHVGNLGGGFVGGYMADIPVDWQKRLGASHLTGQAALAIIGRTSAGPAAFGFNPRDLGTKPALAVPFLYYPISNPLAKEDTQNPIFNTTSQITGIVFPDKTDLVIFFGSHGTGPWWYGQNGDVSGLSDHDRPSKGPHAAPYTYQAWTYKAADLLAAKNRTKQPWQVKPHEIWTFDFPFPDGSKRIGGVAYDQKLRRLFISQLCADRVGYDMNPVIHVFQLAAPANAGAKDQGTR